MYQRGKTAVERFHKRVVVGAALAALGTLFTGCFQAGQDGPGRNRVDRDLSNLSRPFSFGKTNGIAAAKVEVLAAEDVSALLAGSRHSAYGLFPAGEDQPYGNLIADQAPAALPYRLVPSVQDSHDGPGYGSLHPAPATQPAPGLAASAALYLDRSFKSLFASLFKPGSDELALAANSSAIGKEDAAVNPFTEAREKIDASASASSKSSAENPAPAKTGDSSKSTTPGSPPPAASGGGPVNAPPQPRYIFLGDFDGTGTLKAAGADRLDETTFSFQDAQRVFSLYVNPAAVEYQRSFTVEDIDGDGVADLLVTARASLLGGVLLGRDDGTFTVADSFLTGYEPTIAAAGLMNNGRREILVTNIRTGGVVTFRASPHYRQVQSQPLIDFSPDFVSHLVEITSGGDCLMAAQAGRAARIYRWREDSSLRATDESLPAEPSISLSRDFLQDNAVETVDAYQVGSYASITVANSRGHSFNVANIRLMPHIFIAVGDFGNRGTLDVAVAYLRSTASK